MKGNLPDYYSILQVRPEAEPEVIAAAYHRLARKYHPDVNTSPDAARKMILLNEAYEVLSEPAKRAEYDEDVTAISQASQQEAQTGATDHRERARGAWWRYPLTLPAFFLGAVVPALIPTIVLSWFVPKPVLETIQSLFGGYFGVLFAAKAAPGNRFFVGVSALCVYTLIMGLGGLIEAAGGSPAAPSQVASVVSGLVAGALALYQIAGGGRSGHR